MVDDTDDTSFVRPPAPPGLRMPGQAAPIQRTGSPGGSTPGDGVQADILPVTDWLDLVL